MGARYYGAHLGRWTQLDPIDQAADLAEGNRFSYAGSDPVNYTDPTGRFKCLGREFMLAIEINSFGVGLGAKGALSAGGKVLGAVGLASDLTSEPSGRECPIVKNNLPASKLPGFTGGP